MTLSKGFTLIELVMTIVIIGVIAVVAAPKLQLDGFSLRGASQDLVKAIRYTQMQSMNHSGANHYQIQLNGSGFTITQQGVSITDPITGAADYSQDSQLWSGVSSNSTATISFNSRGTPCLSPAPCATPATTNSTITLTKGGDSVIVTLERWTGYAY